MGRTFIHRYHDYSEVFFTPGYFAADEVVDKGPLPISLSASSPRRRSGRTAEGWQHTKRVLRQPKQNRTQGCEVHYLERAKLISTPYNLNKPRHGLAQSQSAKLARRSPSPPCDGGRSDKAVRVRKIRCRQENYSTRSVSNGYALSCR